MKGDNILAKNSDGSKLTALERAWVLYDVGNSAFTMIACSLIPIWFKELAKLGGEEAIAHATSNWAYVTAIVTVIVAVIGPVCGTITDNKGFKKPIFTTALAIGLICCIWLGFVDDWKMFLIVYIIAKVAYSSANTFYDSMLTDVTTPERSDRVSSYGYAWGYIGSCLPFTVALVFFMAGEGMLGGFKVTQLTARIVGCIATAAWWLIVTLPLLKHYEQKYYVIPEKGAVKEAFIRLGATLKRIAKEEKQILYFLIAFFLYIDGVGTIIDNCINIGTDLNLDTVGQVIFLLLTQVVAWLFSLVFSRLSKKYDTVSLILVCIAGYFCVSFYALFLKNLWQFAIMAFGVGMFQGSIQALSRSYFSKIIPAENAGEYFGLYDIFSKGASCLGSLLIGIVKDTTGSIQIAVATLTIFFALGFFFLKKADAVKKA